MPLHGRAQGRLAPLAALSRCSARTRSPCFTRCRLAVMLERLGWEPPVVFSGGVARNPFVLEALAERLGTGVEAAEHPDLLGALGAALHGSRRDATG
ncbi:MAG: hypothetical protein AB1578_00610 [Thermodesulfobacteriota bacterium]